MYSALPLKADIRPHAPSIQRRWPVLTIAQRVRPRFDAPMTDNRTISQLEAEAKARIGISVSPVSAVVVDSRQAAQHWARVVMACYARV
jgi:hypothetical protein